MKKLVLGAVAAAGLLAAAGAHADDQVVRIGTEADYAPFESKDATGNLVGFEIELGNKMCAVAKLKCEWVNMSFDSMIAALQANKIDAVLSQMSITSERQKSVDFTDIVTIAPARFIAEKDSGITDDPATLKGKTIGVQSGTTEEVYYNKKLKPAGIAVKVYESQDQAYLDLQAGRIDADLADETIEWDWLSKTGNKDGYDYVGKELTDVDVFGLGTGIAVRKGDTKLLTALNAALAETIKDGTYQKINAEYFPFSLRPK
jgi:lysine/arginine/ornithine transport system substrate-binding protein